MDTTIKTIKARTGDALYRIRIIYDEMPDSPRRLYDNVGIINCFHKRRDIGDRHDHRHDEFDGWEEFGRHLAEAHGAIHLRPVMLIEHSGTRLYIGTEKRCEFDSGRVGWVYATRGRYAEAYGEEWADLPEQRERLDWAFSVEIDALNDYMNGAVYAYVIEKLNVREGEWEGEESCHGHYGEFTEEEAMYFLNEYIGKVA